MTKNIFERMEREQYRLDETEAQIDDLYRQDSETHELKCDPVPFEALRKGVKTCEMRKNDRKYIAGDYLHLRETTDPPGYPEVNYTGRELLYKITHVQHGIQYGIRPHYVALSIKRVRMISFTVPFINKKYTVYI